MPREGRCGVCVTSMLWYGSVGVLYVLGGNTTLCTLSCSVIMTAEAATAVARAPQMKTGMAGVLSHDAPNQFRFSAWECMPRKSHRPSGIITSPLRRRPTTAARSHDPRPDIEFTRHWGCKFGLNALQCRISSLPMASFPRLRAIRPGCTPG